MIRHIITTMRGTIIAQAIGFAALPILTRLFSPEAFGHLQLYQSLLNILVVLPSLRYDVAVLNVADERELAGIVRICLIANVAMTLLVWALLAALAFVPLGALTVVLPFSAWVPALAMLCSGLIQLLLYFNLRQQAFATIANSRVVQSSSYAAAAIGAGLARVGALGIVGADVIGRIATLAYLAVRGRQRINLPAPVRTLRQIAWQHRALPLFALPGGIINSLGIALTPILIYATFSSTTAGQFGLVERCLSLPVALIVASVSQVFAAQLGQLVREGGDQRAHLRDTVKWLALLSVGPILALVALSPLLFSLLFGPGWQQAGLLARLMAPAYLFVLLAGAVNMTLTIVGRQKTQIAWEIGRLAAMVAIWTIAIRMKLSVTSIVALHAFVLAASSAVFIGLCFHALRDPSGKTAA